MSTNDKVALITGGNRGIGLETARELGAREYRVVLGVRDARQAETAVAALRAEGIAAEAVPYDATKPETDEGLRAHLERTYGRLDVLVNNAGVLREELLSKTAATGTQQELEDTFAVNLFAVVRLTRTLLPLLEKSAAGRT